MICWLWSVILILANFGPVSKNLKVAGLRLTGKFEPADTFFFFLAKFGFQKTEILSKDATQGYIYGNISWSPTENTESTDENVRSLLFDFVKNYKLNRNF